MDTFIKKTLPYIGMVLVVIVVGFFAKQNHNSFEKTIVSQTQRQLLNAVRVEGRLLEQRLSNLTQELEILSENEEVQDVFADGPGRKAVPGFSQLDDSYRDVKSQTVSLSMIDAKGVVIYEVPSKENTGKNLISDADVRKVLTDHKVYADGVVKDALGAYIQAYDQPVFRQGKFVGLLRAVIALETLQSFVSRHEEGDNYSFLLNKEGCLLSYPDQHYLGENLTTLFQDNNLSLKNSKFDALLERVNKGESGSGTCVFFPLDSPHKAEEVIVAFTPVYFGGNVWSLFTAIDYDSIASPVNKNARDNIIFAGIIIFVLYFSAMALYRDQKRKNQELKATQSLLIQSAKLEIVGKLAAGVAHEVKNPLAVIQMSVDYLKNNVKFQDEDVSASLEDAENAVNRADTIIKGLLDFSASSELEIKTQDIHALIDKSLALVKHAREKNHVRVAKSFGKDIPEVGIDRNKIEQVFVNLLMNAIQAMPAGGELQVRTFRAGASETRQMVMVQVEDQGTGIPEHILKDLFVPFVTSKREVGGTGLGLSIVRNIMEMHGGKIALENKPRGQGVRATLWFKI